MNPVRKWIRDVFGFSGNEVNGFLILIPLMVLMIFSEPVYHRWMARQERQDPRDAKRLDSLLAFWRSLETPPAEAAVMQEVAIFGFDPNTVSVDELRRLGFSSTSANRIAAYRRKGGVFTVKSDLLKIYGLDSTLYHQLYSYIQLPSRRLQQEKRYHGPAGRSERWVEERVTRRFDINTADTTLLKTVYGIGPVLAARIVKFRNALGGFVNPDQLKEVYGLDSAVVQRLLKTGFINPDFVPAKININTADEKTLSGHPYIRNKIANALITYRFQHGGFPETGDIRKLSIMQPDDVERILPYIKVKD